MKKLFWKEKKKRYTAMTLEKNIYVLKYIIENTTLNQEVRNFAYQEFQNLLYKGPYTKIHNRCIFTNRVRGILRFFKLSRLAFKRSALQCDLMGVKKASW